MTAPTIRVGDLVMWANGHERLCEQPHWAASWNHHSCLKSVIRITRDGVMVWQARTVAA